MMTTFLFPCLHPGTENPHKYKSTNTNNATTPNRFTDPLLGDLGELNGGVIYPFGSDASFLPDKILTNNFVPSFIPIVRNSVHLWAARGEPE
jgi:hypothetical protein